MFGRAGLIATAVLAGMAGIWLYGQSRYQAGQAAQREAQMRAELIAFQYESERLTGLSATLSEQLDHLAAFRPAVIERYTHEIRNAPLPFDCVLDAGRLRQLNAAIDAANLAAESGRPLPAGADAFD